MNLSNMKRLLSLVLTLLASGVVMAELDVNRPKVDAAKQQTPSGSRTANFSCAPPSSRAVLDINNVRAMIHNGGDMWWDLVGTPRYEIPKSIDPGAVTRTSLFCGGIWIGGVDPDNTSNLFVTAQTYRQSGQMTYWPGPLDSLSGATSRQRCSEWNQHFKIERLTVQQFYSDYRLGLVRDISQVPDQIKYWPGKGNRHLRTRPGQAINNTNFNLARFVDVNGDGTYEPLDGDYPQLPGDEGGGIQDILASADQVFFWVSNDAGNVKNLGGGNQTSPAIGMEVHTEAFAYATADPRNDMTFYRNRLINKGQVTLDQTYFGQWVDPDLGFAYDDYVGCDVARGLGICYNGDEFDDGIAGYGFNPPSIGVDFFIGPVADPNDGIDNDKDGTIDEEGEKIIMSNFLYYNNDGNDQNGNPSSAQDYYNYLRNIWRSKGPVRYDGKNGASTDQTLPAATFVFPDDSDQKICWGSGGTLANPCPAGKQPTWNEVSAGNQPGDRRFLSSAGPFRLRPGAVNQLTIGVVWARASQGGATGSLNKLKTNDDLSQKLFDRDFKILLGPNEPKVEIVELDKELALVITPDTFAGQTTEDYKVVDRNLNPLEGDNTYKFQGYLVYQLKDATVGTADFNDPAKAQIVAQCDLKDGVASIYNFEYDPIADDIVKTLKVVGSDTGLFHTIRLNKDFFNPSQQGLVNFKKYYYRVIAYAHNSHPANEEPFLLGFPRRDPQTGRLVDRIEAIPHNISPEKGGTVLKSAFGDGFDITRISGMGNGGTYLGSISAAEENNILRDGITDKMTFPAGQGPVKVKVYNPKRVKGGDFTIAMSSRLRYNRLRTNLSLQVGDRIVCAFDTQGTTRFVFERNQLGQTIARRDYYADFSVRQKPAVAVVNRILPISDSLVDLDVEVLNDNEGGTFILTQKETITKLDPSTNRPSSDETFQRYNLFGLSFFKQGAPGITARTVQFDRHDYWKLSESNSGTVVYNQRPISTENEQLVPQFGISIRVTDTTDPFMYYERNKALGYVGASLTASDGKQPWMVLIPHLPVTTIVGQSIYRHLVDDRTYASGNTNVRTFGYYTKFDSKLIFTKMQTGLNVTGGVAPYMAAMPWDSGGARRPNQFGLLNYPVSRISGIEQAVTQNLTNLRNVDIVFTEDKTKWTRCLVLQGDGVTRAERVVKSTVPSVDIDGNQIDVPAKFQGRRNQGTSKGLGWFPGYAIDLDRGVRLNMAFSEAGFLELDGLGSDNKFRYGTVTPLGLFISYRNYVYVMNTPYNVNEPAREIEAALDSIAADPSANNPRAAVISQGMSDYFGRNFMYVVNPTAVQGVNRVSQDCRIQVRVSKAFESFPAGTGEGVNKAPAYTFSTWNKVPLMWNDETASSALDKIRVVPNPFYAYSPYEQAQNASFVKITNLPTKCDVYVYNLSGTLIRHFPKDLTGARGLNETTYLEWDLKNQVGIPVASGTYLVVVDAGSLGTKVVKWFGVMRPLDMDGTNQN